MVGNQKRSIWVRHVMSGRLRHRLSFMVGLRSQEAEPWTQEDALTSHYPAQDGPDRSMMSSKDL